MFLWKKKTLNYEERKYGLEPYIILLHYTGMKDAASALNRLTDPESKVSAHYMVDEDGSVHTLVPEDMRAWHAGDSYWDRERDINSASIGIEIVNPGHEWGYREFPQVQTDAVLNLCREIQERHTIIHVLGHSDVAPERKQDPGELFDWHYLARHNVGFWPYPSDDDIKEAERIYNIDYEVQRLFVEFGYNPMAAFEDVITAFHRHYFPSKFQTGEQGKLCKDTLARLYSLVHQLRDR